MCWNSAQKTTTQNLKYNSNPQFNPLDDALQIHLFPTHRGYKCHGNLLFKTLATKNHTMFK